MNIASYVVHGFIIGSVLGSSTLLAKQSGPTRNIIAALLSIGFCVVVRIIDVSLWFYKIRCMFIKYVFYCVLRANHYKHTCISFYN